ncbi:MAG: putative lipid II flippase FtsW [Elusimicrobiota bacterium]
MRVETSKKSYNLWVFVITLILVSIGTIMVFSASGIMADYRYGTAFTFFLKQLLWVGIGLLSMLIFSAFDYNKLKKIVPVLLIFTVILLVMVLLLGPTIAGTKRWLKFGPVGFQPSEIAKLTVVFFLAWYVDRRTSKMKNFQDGLIRPFIIISIIAGLIYLERDVGVPVLIFLLALVLLFIGGLRKMYIVFAGLIVSPLIFYAILKEPYRLKRLTAFLNPWADPQGSGYQLIQSFLAMGSGGLAGKGLGNSQIKMLFLPEPHTDFIFPIIGEEFGLIGTMAILLLFFGLFYFGIKIALHAKNLFGTLLAFGITIMITLQMIINISVSIGIFPTKGLPLPFISFGGSSMVVMLTGIGILLNIGKQLKIKG